MMQIEAYPGAFLYKAASGDWHVFVGNGRFEIRDVINGTGFFGSGVNLDNLAALIVSAKAHAVANGINWSGN